ncbi:MAG: replication initiator protein A [Lachnospiraceae bacterium]|nr:replication initiator protein A [Lachnospiraceae bacterium]
MAENKGQQAGGFDYYYGQEGDQFSFFRIPRVLIKDRRFADLSSDAKLLYGLLLDRMALSRSNGWLDADNRVYIIYTMQEIREDLGCGKDKAIKTMAELDSAKGIGLVERKRRGLGLPDILYIKNFIVKKSVKPDKSAESGNTGFKKSEKQTSGGRGNRTPDVGDPETKRSEKQTSRMRENRPPEVGNPEANYNKTNDTDSSHILSIHRDTSGTKMYPAEGDDGLMDDDTVLAQIRSNIGYDSHMLHDGDGDRQCYCELYRVIADVIRGHPETVRIGDSVFPYDVVRSRMMKLTDEHMEYVRQCILDNAREIRSMKKYMLAALYNAPATMATYYTQLVRHDMYGGGWQERGII